MKASNSLVLVKDSLELLRQIRANLYSESRHSLGLEIDEAIEQLEEIERTGVHSPDTINRVLTLFGQGLAAIPYIAKLIESLSDR